MSLHKTLAPTDIHVPYSFTYANAAARTGAVGLVTADVGKFALQTDDNSIWLLTAITPVWKQVDAAGVTYGSVVALTVGGPNVDGTAPSVAHSDHKHALPAFGAIAGTFTEGNDSRLSNDRTASGLRTASTIVVVSAATAPTAGQVLTATSGTAADWESPIALSSGSPTTIQPDDAAAPGVGTTSSRFDHKHAIVADVPITIDRSANVEGTSTSFARADHKHDISTAAPVDVGTANAAGSAATLAKSDHVHNTPFSAVQTALGAATSDISVNTHKITNVVDPTANQDAATKLYVDTAASIVTPARTLTAGAGLTGGGDLSANRTFNVGANVDGSITVNADDIQVGILATDAQHGVRGGGTQHALVVPAGAAGFMSGTDKTKLDGVGALASTPPTTILPDDSAAVGVGTTAARDDHRHAIAAATAGAILIGDAAAEGASTSFARADHTHSVAAPAAPADVNRTAASAGASTAPARADHKHDVSVGVPGTIAVGDAAAGGAASSLARSDHTHALPAPAAPVNVTKAAASAGASTTVARADHKHDITTAAPVDVGVANAEGTATSIARSDHVHNVPFSAVNVALGAANASISVNNQKITNLTDPTSAQDAATKIYVDAARQGLDVKISVRVASTANIATLSGLLTIDGVTTVVGNRVLVKDQITGSANGIYDAAVGAWTRSTDADTSAKVTSGLFTFIEEGSTQASQGWVLVTADPIVLGTTSLSFTQFTGLGEVIAGTGLTKTGNTLNVIANADGSIIANADDVQVGILATDAQHGVRGGGTQHALVIAAGAAGFMSGTDKTKLDGIASGATNTPLASTAPTTIQPDASAAVGVGTTAARDDHRHAIVADVAGAIAIGDAAAEGASTSFARADHVHSLAAPAAPVDVTRAAASAGASTAPARADHKHDVSVGTPGTIAVGDAAAGGAASSLARSDHTHALPAPAAPADVTKAAASAGAATTVARADHKHDVSTATPGTVTYAAAAEGTATSLARSDHTHAVTSPAAPVNVTKAAAAAGTATAFARDDHKHDVSTAAPAATGVSTASAEGTATTLARSDHSHQSNTAPVNVTKAAAAIGTSGEPARADHKHDITTAAVVDIGTANAEGTATSIARSDHVHNLPFSAVQTALGAASSSISVNNQKITNLADPTLAQDAATKAYADLVVAQTDFKESCRFATTANINLATTGLTAIDGITPSAGERALVKNQTTGSENGIYVAAVGAWARSTDANTSAKVTSGLFVHVSEGTVNADSDWHITTNDPIVLGTTSLTFEALGLLASAAPADVTKAAAAVGTSLRAARADHKHDVTTAAPGTVTFAAAAEGTATTLARSDHTHALTSPAAPADVTKAAASAGASANVARQDHKHDVSTAAPGATGVATASAEGTATSLARSDHTHQSNTAPVNVTKAAAAIGTSGEPARADHKHDITTAAPGATSVATASADGAATSLARSDHTHQSNTAPVNVTKAAAAIGTSGEPARADHKHDITTAVVVGLGTALAEGTATSLARSDHVHIGDPAQLMWGNDGVSTTTTTRYLLPGYGESTARTTVVQFYVSRAGTLTNLRIRQNTGAGNGNSIVYTLRVNSVGSTLSVSMASTANSGGPDTDLVTVAAGDLLDIEVTKAASIGTSPSDIVATVEFRS